jgi:hypothetical protein
LAKVDEQADAKQLVEADFHNHTARSRASGLSMCECITEVLQKLPETCGEKRGIGLETWSIWFLVIENQYIRRPAVGAARARTDRDGQADWRQQNSLVGPIHFVGIGGIGIWHRRGVADHGFFTVQGSDLAMEMLSVSKN